MKEFTSLEATINSLENFNYDKIPKPNTTANNYYGNPNPYGLSKLYDCWLEWDTTNEGWFPCSDFPSGFIALDVETTDNTRTLAIASAVHFESGRLFFWFSNPQKYDNQKLISLSPGTFMVAHRSTFEASFIEGNFQPQNPTFKGLCTYAIAAAARHPGKVSLFRAQPFLPQFRRSSDCSLAGLYFLATGEVMDKEAVNVFIKSAGYEWARPPAQNLLDAGIYDDYLKGKAGSKYKKLNLPERLSGVKKFKPLKISKLIKNIEAYHYDISLPLSPTTKLIHHSLGLVDISPEVLTPEEYTKLLIEFLPNQDPVKSAVTYNIFDTLATVEVIRMLIYDLKNLDNKTFVGMVERSTPMFFLDPKFEDQLERIEDTFQTRSAELDAESELWVRDHLSTAGDWDGQDWTPNSERCSATKRGVPVWFDTKKLGFSKSLTAIAIRPHFEGKPLKRFKTTTPLLTEDGTFFFQPNPNLRPRGMFTVINSDPDFSYEENMAKATIDNSVPWEHPFSTDTKAFKGVGSLFSSTMFPLWESGQLTCDYPVKDQIQLYMGLSYWRAMRKRLFNLKIVQTKYGKAVSPRSHINGTVTGRTVDSVFLVLAKHSKEKIGSELQGFFVAPPGYKIVQFDLDSAQARFAALICDAEYARENGLKKVTLMSTPFSQRIFKGSKKGLSTVAHELGRVAGYDYTDEKELKIGYAKGKNAQFSLIFGVGALKLSKMVNILCEKAIKMVLSFKGEKDKNSGFYKGGDASWLFNGQLRMTRSEFPVKGNAAEWVEDKQKLMRSTVLGRALPFCLSPVYAGKSDITTRCNSTIQGGDVDFMNFITAKSAPWFHNREIIGRFCHTVHDAFLWIIKDEYVKEFVYRINVVHSEAYLRLFQTWNVDLKSVPENVWYPESIDVTQRWLKSVDDVKKKNSATDSYEGYEGLDGDEEDIEEGSLETLFEYE